MGADGAKGLLKMKNAGAFTIGQDKDTCIVYGMPMVAFNMGGVVKQAPLQSITGIILDKLR
ncbi:MAG: chemotaxis response regulator protein-glutamate methylesterase, partial [Oscillospiraceae bacterium]|nr:chemotaxis response regulator protein-glutamate methylesterase [Oscillospiraceae bacterium]